MSSEALLILQKYWKYDKFRQPQEQIIQNVLEGKDLVTNNTNIIKQDVNVTGKNFRYIQTKSTFTPAKKDAFFKSTLFYLLLISPLIFIPIGIFIAKKNEERSNDIIGNKLRKTDRLARKYLSEAQKQLGKKELFYEALELALHNYLKAKLRVETSEISQDKIAVILAEKNVDSATIKTFTEVLNSCDFARYTPITNVEMHDEYEKAKQVIIELDKQL